MANLLTDLQDAIADRLRADGEFSGVPSVPVVTQSAGDVATEIADRVKSCGVVVHVMTPSWKPNEEDRFIFEVSLEVGIAENVLNNRGPTGTGKRGHDLAIMIHAILDNYQPPGGWTKLRCKGGSMQEFTKAVVTHSVTFETAVRVRVVPS